MIPAGSLERAVAAPVPGAATPVTVPMRVRGYVALTKPRIIELLLVTTVPTMLVAARGFPHPALVATTVVGGTLAAGGANAANMVIDRDIDAVMTRTRSRPLVTGAVGVRSAAIFSLLLEVAAFGLLWGTANLLSAALAVGAAAFYVGIYTSILKRRWASNIVIGGAAGAAPVLVGWSAVTGGLSVPAVLLFVLIFVWTPPHFWALAVRYERDYAAAEVPMLPTVTTREATARRVVAYSAVTAAVGTAAAATTGLGWPLVVATAALGVWFLGRSVTFRRSLGDRDAMRLFGASITYLSLYFVALAVAAVVRHL